MPENILIEDIAKGLGLVSLTHQQKTYIYIYIQWWGRVQKFLEKEPKPSEKQASELIEHIKQSQTILAELRKSPSEIKQDFFDLYEDFCSPIDGVSESDIFDELEEFKRFSDYQVELEKDIALFTNQATEKQERNSLPEVIEIESKQLKNNYGEYVQTVKARNPKKALAKIKFQEMISLNGKDELLVSPGFIGHLKQLPFNQKKIKSGQFRESELNTILDVQELVTLIAQLIIGLEQLRNKTGFRLNKKNLDDFYKVIEPYFSHKQYIEKLDVSTSRELFEKLNVIKSIAYLNSEKNSTSAKFANLRIRLANAIPKLVNLTVPDIDPDLPLTRVLLIHPDDINDAEILNGIRVMIQKHNLNKEPPHKENIILASSEKEIIEINKMMQSQGKNFKLQVFGHGSLENAILGPIKKGTAKHSAEGLGKLINQCSQISYLRISSCMSGALKDEDNLDRAQYFEKRKKGRKRTLTFISDHYKGTKEQAKEDPTANIFHDKSVAKACWNKINKSNREFSMTVSPGVIVPNLESGAILSTKEEDTIRDIHLSTSGGIKARSIKPRGQ